MNYGTYSGFIISGYEQNWSERLYIVTGQKSSFDVCYYTGKLMTHSDESLSVQEFIGIHSVKPQRGEELERPFYRAELNLVTRS